MVIVIIIIIVKFIIVIIIIISVIIANDTTVIINAIVFLSYLIFVLYIISFTSRHTQVIWNHKWIWESGVDWHTDFVRYELCQTLYTHKTLN